MSCSKIKPSTGSISKKSKLLMIKKHIYKSREELYEAVANRCAQQVTRGIEKQGRASLVVPGGSTPAPVFKKLSAMSLNWHNVKVAPSDDRWVSNEHEQSNEKLIRETLLTDKAEKAEFVSLKTDFSSPQKGCRQAEANFNQIEKPIDLVLLGMGGDGHFASLFPGVKNFDKATALDSKEKCIAIDATGCSVAGSLTDRISLTLAAILDSHVVALLITGDEKLNVIENAMKEADTEVEPTVDEDVASYPIVKLLKQTKTPIEIYWAA